jgi:hypothetical protein
VGVDSFTLDNGPGITHIRNIQVLRHVGIPFPTGPNEIQLIIQLHHCSIDRPLIRRIRDLPFFHKSTGERVGIAIFQNKHAMIIIIAITGRGSIINVPFAI